MIHYYDPKPGGYKHLFQDGGVELQHLATAPLH